MSSVLIKNTLIFMIFLSVMTMLGVVVPDQMTDNINEAIIFFLNQVNYLSAFSPDIVSALFACMKLLSNFMVIMASFYVIVWLMNKIG